MEDDKNWMKSFKLSKDFDYITDESSTRKTEFEEMVMFPVTGMNHNPENTTLIKQEFTPGCGHNRDKNRGRVDKSIDVTTILDDLLQRNKRGVYPWPCQYSKPAGNSDTVESFSNIQVSKANAWEMVAFDLSLDANEKNQFLGSGTGIAARKEELFASLQNRGDVLVNCARSMQAEQPCDNFSKTSKNGKKVDGALLQTDKDIVFEEGLDFAEAEQWMTDISEILKAPEIDMDYTETKLIATNIEGEDTIVESHTGLGLNDKQAKSLIGTREVNLLVEALQTRSFTPILYLLSSVLGNNGDIECLLGETPDSRTITNGWNGRACPDVPSHFSILEHRVPILSQQTSVDSDTTSTWPDSHTRQSWSDCSTDNEEFFTDSRPKFNSKSTAKMQPFGNLDSTANHVASNNYDMGFMSVIDDMMQPNAKCDLQTFKNLLEQDRPDESETATEKKRPRVWKSIGTGTDSLNYDRDVEGANEPDNAPKREIKSANHRPGPNKCYHLWDFLRELLDSDQSPGLDVVEWIDKEKREFRLKDTKQLAELWGKKKKLSNMNYDKLSRSLRYYIKLDILRKVPGKRLYFRFGKGRMWRKMNK
ncbi:uncharacterized protein LOC135695060 [Rhopilema esculentum]|uniref:uncharacterized protein LOC135695060 n=1 Tax=Rhopilema esculentum TaxID=499914 RepID=UPI0031D8707F|eukprot:gene4727-21026_t